LPSLKRGAVKLHHNSNREEEGKMTDEDRRKMIEENVKFMRSITTIGALAQHLATVAINTKLERHEETVPDETLRRLKQYFETFMRDAGLQDSHVRDAGWRKNKSLGEP
jgi:hypothetical protein